MKHFLYCIILLVSFAPMSKAAVENQPEDTQVIFEEDDIKYDVILEEMKSRDPEKAEQLIELRREKPEEFNKAITEYIKSNPPRRMREPREGDGPHQERITEWLKKREADYLEWLNDNYPEQAKELLELKEGDPALYRRQLMVSVRKYGPIIEASRINPELEEVLKKDLELKEEQDGILAELRTAANEDERKELIEELKGIVAEHFDILVKKREIGYQQLLKKLEQLKEEIRTKEAEVKKWKDEDFKKEAVNARIERMLSKSENFEWN